MEETGRSALIGIILGVAIAAAVLVTGFDWGVHQIKTATLSVKPPLLFVPK